jgi:hypothetical protein
LRLPALNNQQITYSNIMAIDICGPIRLASGLLMTTVALAMIAGPVRAEVLTDGLFSLNIESNGQFNQIFFGDLEISGSTFVQSYYVNGIASFSDGSPVNIVAQTATYTAVAEGMNVTVVSTLLPGVASDPTNTRILEQTLTFTNPTANPIPLRVVSHADVDLPSSGLTNTVEFVTAQNAIIAAGDDNRIYGAIARSSVTMATLGWDASEFGLDTRDFPMGNTMSAEGDIVANIGLNNGDLGAGQSATLTFRYLFGVERNTLPEDFVFPAGMAVPEPGTLALLLPGIGAGIAAGIRRRRAAIKLLS